MFSSSRKYKSTLSDDLDRTRTTTSRGRRTLQTSSDMDHFSSKDMALKVQKKILSSVANKTSVQMFIDDTASDILDELYRYSKEYSGNKSEAQKVIKDLIKIAVKIGLLFRNNRFSTEELSMAQDFKKKLHQGAMTAISFYEVDFTFDKTVMAELLTSCRDLLLKLVNTHLTPKSHGRINHVFNHYADPELLTKLYEPDGHFRPNLSRICKGLNKLVEDGTI
uniref:tumor necrosis factor, alpha-induced protein 8-like protein 2 B n=1 Tax=Doryrhamphus excisus TaxID=161450 RepID=UPI0025AE01B2|nr:tumor necrosis factor, alpha-induced protein 8-like protein 2 B [Doryrhamphus excisus]